MAKITSLFSKPSGKLASIVFASWKGIAYGRLYVIPANPNTALQQVTRNKFKLAVYMAKAILGSVLNPFWDPFIKENSGYARFIGDFIKTITTEYDFLLIKVASGTLESTAILTSVYAGGNVTITWSTACLSNGLATDKACCLVYDVAHHVAFFNGAAARSAGTQAVAVGTGRTASFLKAYLFFSDSLTAPTVVSDSDAAQVSL